MSFVKTPRSWGIALGILVLVAPLAQAQCGPSCTGGGGPAATDCFLAFSGLSGSTVTCTDGDACDADGTIDGTCTFGFGACTNATVGSCGPTPLDAAPTASVKGAGAEDFVAALAGLSTTAPDCTKPDLVRLSIATSSKKLKPAKTTIRTTAIAGGKKDVDRVKLVCNPARPSLGTHVQPIFTATCTFAGCHSGSFPEQSLSLEAGEAAAGLIDQRALLFPKLARVKPGSLKKSYLTSSLLGGNGATLMPYKCPTVEAPVERCLTAAEIYTILAWIQAGALP
jgi:hypothetical protein